MVSEDGTVARRRMRTIAEKQRIVEETLVRGASVAAVARKHDVNANLLFGWRRLYKQGLLETCREPAPRLLPVEVTTPTIVASRSERREVARPLTSTAPDDAATRNDQIEIAWPDGVRVRVQGSVDPGALKTVLAAAIQKNR